MEGFNKLTKLRTTALFKKKTHSLGLPADKIPSLSKSQLLATPNAITAQADLDQNFFADPLSPFFTKHGSKREL